MTKNILRNVVIKGEKMQFFDARNSNTALIVESEINSGEYSALIDGKINFQPRDIFIDIGGNIGLVSILLAKKYPFLKIYAFEPVFENWKNFKRNMHLNGVSSSQIKLHNCAITCDERLVKMNVVPSNSGASTMINKIYQAGRQQTVKSVALNWVFENYKIDKCKALKIDCEGAEFEILYNFKNFEKIEFICGETHSFDDQKNNRKSLLQFLETKFAKEKMEFSGY